MAKKSDTPEKKREWADVNEDVKFVCQGGKVQCPFASPPINVGYLTYDNCRVRVRGNGNIEFWPEHFGWFARGEWNQMNFPYIHEGKIYIDANGQQHLGIPRTIGRVQRAGDSRYSSHDNGSNQLSSNDNKYSENLRNRDMPEIEDNTPKSPVDIPPGRVQRSIKRRTGGTVAPPPGLRGTAVATLILDLALMTYDVIAPISMGIEQDKIGEHFEILVGQVIEDVNIAYRSGWMEKELSLREASQLMNVILYGEREGVSDYIWTLGKEIYRHISKYKKVD